MSSAAFVVSRVGGCVGHVSNHVAETLHTTFECFDPEDDVSKSFDVIKDLSDCPESTVSMCRERDSGKMVVVKLLKQVFLDKNLKATAALEEALLLKSTSHPNIVNLIYNPMTSKAGICLVMEVVDSSLKNELRLKKSGLHEDKIKMITWQILQATAFLHCRNMTHQRLDPSRVLLSDKSVVKLCGFNTLNRGTLSDQSQGAAASRSAADNKRWNYTAPETLVGGPCGPYSDIWAIGCLMGEMIQGRPIFPGKNIKEQLSLIMKGRGPLPGWQMHVARNDARLAKLEPPTAEEMRPLNKRLNISDPNLLEVLEACLNTDPLQRPSAIDILGMTYFKSVKDLLKGTGLEKAYNATFLDGGSNDTAGCIPVKMTARPPAGPGSSLSFSRRRSVEVMTPDLTRCHSASAPSSSFRRRSSVAIPSGVSTPRVSVSQGFHGILDSSGSQTSDYLMNPKKTPSAPTYGALQRVIAAVTKGINPVERCDFTISDNSLFEAEAADINRVEDQPDLTRPSEVAALASTFQQNSSVMDAVKFSAALGKMDLGGTGPGGILNNMRRVRRSDGVLDSLFLPPRSQSISHSRASLGANGLASNSMMDRFVGSDPCISRDNFMLSSIPITTLEEECDELQEDNSNAKQTKQLGKWESIRMMMNKAVDSIGQLVKPKDLIIKDTEKMEELEDGSSRPDASSRVTQTRLPPSLENSQRLSFMHPGDGSRGSQASSVHPSDVCQGSPVISPFMAASHLNHRASDGAALLPSSRFAAPSGMRASDGCALQPSQIVALSSGLSFNGRQQPPSRRSMSIGLVDRTASLPVGRQIALEPNPTPPESYCPIPPIETEEEPAATKKKKGSKSWRKLGKTLGKSLSSIGRKNE